MGLKAPFTFVRHRRNLANARKPTAHSKINALPYINPQVTSPLFSQLPGEIRHLIYEYALLGYPNRARPYSKHSYHYRPGYTYARAINTNLLLSCRRIYLEVGHLAVIQNEHLIYQPLDHGPPGHWPYLLPCAKAAKSSAGPRGGLLKLEQRRMIQQVHIFVQQSWLEGWNRNWREYCSSWSRKVRSSPDDRSEQGICKHPPRLRITIRHSDWWYFLLGRSSPLALDAKRMGRARPGVWVPEDAAFEIDSWGSQFGLLKGLNVFELELETLWEKRGELDAVIDRAKAWHFALGDGNILVCNHDATTTTIWKGSKHLKGLPSSVTASTTPPSNEASTDLSSTSRAKAQINLVPELAEENCLNYLIVTLTWHAQPGPSMKEGEAVDSGHGEEDDDDFSVGDETSDAASPAAPPGTPPATQAQAQAQGIFAHHVAQAPRREAFPTYYG